MGNRASHGESDGSDFSDSSEIDCSALDSFRSMSHTHSAIDCNVDAAITTHSLVIKLLNHDQLKQIQKGLDVYEMISIVFLLVDDCNKSLDIMLKTSKHSGEFMLFLNDYVKSLDATKKLIEALCIIQNYEVLQAIGYQKSTLSPHFLPLNSRIGVDVNKVRKACYRVLEHLTPDLEKELLQVIIPDIQETCNCLMSSYPYMEMNVAYLFFCRYITDDDLSNLIKHFKALEMDQYVDMLSFAQTSSQHSSPQRPSGQSQLNTDKSTTGHDHAIASTSMHMQRKNSISGHPNIYPMDVNNPGIVLIIENVHFWEDQEDIYKELVIVTDEGLGERSGSTEDSKRLEDIFGRFGFEIIHEKNKTHVQMLDLITDVAYNRIKSYHSSFILIMLSHGVENQIIGCNSVPVNVNDIKQIINSKVLEDKPKILIFQACQGSAFLKIQSDELCTDGPTSLKMAQNPWQKHILEYWSAVPGYVSFRDKRKGSWMIQTLCNVLEKQEIDSFIDVCTEVNRILGKRRVEFLPNQANLMITPATSTLDKKFVLPPLKPKHT